MDLAAQRVLVTGASSGIGRACAAAFAHEGARVALASRRADIQTAIADDLSSKDHGDGMRRVLPLTMDVTREQERRCGLEQIGKLWGGLDILLNNAGWAGFGPLEKQEAADIDRMILLNLLAPVALIQAVLPGMIERGGGVIVNVASILAYQPFPRMAVYGAAKAALLRLSQGLRLELRGTGVRVICICPASTNTPFFEHVSQTGTCAQRSPRTQLTPEAVAATVVRACRRRRCNRDIAVGGQAHFMDLLRRLSPRLADGLANAVARRTMPEL